MVLNCSLVLIDLWTDGGVFAAAWRCGKASAPDLADELG